MNVATRHSHTQSLGRISRYVFPNRQVKESLPGASESFEGRYASHDLVFVTNYSKYNRRLHGNFSFSFTAQDVDRTGAEPWDPLSQADKSKCGESCSFADLHAVRSTPLRTKYPARNLMHPNATGWNLAASGGSIDKVG
jgi:hypothetical protein